MRHLTSSIIASAILLLGGTSVRADYDAFEIYRGHEIIDQYIDSHSTNAGFLQLEEYPQHLNQSLPNNQLL